MFILYFKMLLRVYEDIMMHFIVNNSLRWIHPALIKLYMASLLYVFSHVPVDTNTKISESFSGQVVTRMDSSRTYPYGQPDVFSKYPFYHSISHTNHIYKVSLLYVFSYVSLDDKISESFYYRDCKGKAYTEISLL